MIEAAAAGVKAPRVMTVGLYLNRVLFTLGARSRPRRAVTGRERVKFQFEGAVRFNAAEDATKNV
jgi:hypothetical protein